MRTVLLTIAAVLTRRRVPPRLLHRRSGPRPRVRTSFTSWRSEVVYNIEPFRAGLRPGDWKLIWQTTLPSKVELYDLARDPSEKTNVADQNAQVVAELKQRIEALSREAVPPLIFGEALPALKAQLFRSVVLPADVKAVAEEP